MKKHKILMVGLLVMSSVLAMARPIDLKLKNVTVEQAITELNKSGNYSIVLDPQEVDLSKVISVDAKNASIESVMDQILEGQDLNYSVEGKLVKVSKKSSQSSNNVAKNNAGPRKTVSGTITDANGPVVGAVVLVKGTTNGTVTDLDGHYSLSVKENDILEVSCLGYMTALEQVATRSTIDVILKDDSTVLADAVVLGYGVATKKKDLSASVGIISDASSITSRPVADITNMLQGQIPGLTVSANGGDPTQSPSIVIRGQGSKPNTFDTGNSNFSSSESVLWVVDGIPGAPIANPSDIESIVVLKDAASAAIYGAQSGAGGVILVTTKKGRKGLILEYDGLGGIHQPTNIPRQLDATQQLNLHRDLYTNSGLTIPDGWDLSKNPWAGVTRTNWLDEIFRVSPFQRHGFTINYGNDKLTTRISLNHQDDEGTLINTYNKSTGVHFYGEYHVNSWLKLTEDMTWKRNDKRGAGHSNDSSTSIIFLAMGMPQSAEAYYADGSLGGCTTNDPEYIAKYGSNFDTIYGNLRSPLYYLVADTRYDKSTNFFSTTGLEIANLVKGLKFNSKFSYFYNNSFYKNFSPKFLAPGKPVNENTLDYSTSEGSGWKTENTLTYDRTFGKHSVGALLSTTANSDISRNFWISGNGLTNESASLQYMKYAETATITGGDGISGEDANVAAIGRLSYSYDDRYFVTASWRRDYAGRLPKQHNYGDFPAVTGAWKISSEPFFPKTEAVTLLKVRSSWGRIGNLGSISRNYKTQTLNAGSSSKYALYGPGTNTLVGTTISSGTVVNPNLTWETSEQFDLGLDVNFLNDRLTTSFDYYNKRTYNLIQSQSMNWPQTIGVGAMLVNQGEIMNRGFEAMVGWNDKVGNWSYFINANLAYNKNWISDIGVKDASGNPGVWITDPSGGIDAGDGYKMYHQTAEGLPVSSCYLIKCLGIFQNQAEVDAYTKDGNKIQPNAQPGDLKFEDFNNDGIIDNNDRQYMGKSNPDFTYALSAGFKWKNLSFSMMLQGVQGVDVLNMSKLKTMTMQVTGYNRDVRILNAWTPDNTDTDLPRLSLNNSYNFAIPSSWLLEDGSYLRIKNVTVSYDLTSLLHKCNHFVERNSSMSVYFSGENLFTFTNYSGIDPECGGWDTLKYPVSRVLSLGVKISY